MDEEQFREGLLRMAEGLPPPGESRAVVGRARRRIVRNSALGIVVISLVSFGAVALRPSSKRVISFTNPTGAPIEVSAVSGSIKCVARFGSDIVGPGHSTGMTFTIENVGNQPIEVPPGTYGKLQVRDAAGKHVWPTPANEPTVMGLGTRRGMPVFLKPNERIQVPRGQPLIQWARQVSVEPTCRLGRKDLKLPAVGLTVRVPKRIVPEEVLKRATEKTGGLFGPCSPKPDGSWSEGLITPPKAGYKPPEFDREMRPPAADIRPMRVRCAVLLREELGFWIVNMVMVTPASAPQVPVEPPVGANEYENLPGTGSMAVSRFQLIITSEATVNTHQVATTYRTRPGVGKVFYGEFSYQAGERGIVKWRRSAEGVCGGMGGGGAYEVSILFINACPP